jgi:DNA polymerase
MNQLAKLTVLRDEWADCDKCGLCETRRHVVFGDGNPEADILIVGEAPGAEEDKTGYPFQGKSGKTLDDFLKVAGLSRETDLFITNVVGCRPTMENVDERTGELKTENRNPSRKEREACQARLEETIYIVDPLLIITLGKVAFQALTGKSTIFTKLRGQVQTIDLPGRHGNVRYPVLPMYHPAFLERTFNFKASGPWGDTGKDFLMACNIIDELRYVYRGIEKPTRVADLDEGKKGEEEDEKEN